MNGNMAATFIPLVLLLVVMYFLLIRPQKKREKQVNEMRNSVRVGDEIITIGGICGKVVKTKDESLVIQVGADKVKFEVMRWSVSKVVESAKNTKKVSVPAPDEDDDEPKKAMPKRLKKKSAAENTEEPKEEKQETKEEPDEAQADNAVSEEAQTEAAETEEAVSEEKK